MGLYYRREVLNESIYEAVTKISRRGVSAKWNIAHQMLLRKVEPLKNDKRLMKMLGDFSNKYKDDRGRLKYEFWEQRMGRKAIDPFVERIEKYILSKYKKLTSDYLKFIKNKRIAKIETPRIAAFDIIWSLVVPEKVKEIVSSSQKDKKQVLKYFLGDPFKQGYANFTGGKSFMDIAATKTRKQMRDYLDQLVNEYGSPFSSSFKSKIEGVSNDVIAVLLKSRAKTEKPTRGRELVVHPKRIAKGSIVRILPGYDRELDNKIGYIGNRQKVYPSMKNLVKKDLAAPVLLDLKGYEELKVLPVDKLEVIPDREAMKLFAKGQLPVSAWSEADIKFRTAISNLIRKKMLQFGQFGDIKVDEDNVRGSLVGPRGGELGRFSINTGRGEDYPIKGLYIYRGENKIGEYENGGWIISPSKGIRKLFDDLIKSIKGA